MAIDEIPGRPRLRIDATIASHAPATSSASRPSTTLDSVSWISTPVARFA